MGSTLLLVELSNADEVYDDLGHGSMELFAAEFESRLRQLARPRDEVVQILPNKYCLVLQDVWDPEQVELAAAKLTRLFEEPVSLLDEEIQPQVHAAFVPPGNRRLDRKAQVRIAESALREAQKANVAYVVRDAVETRSRSDNAKREREVARAMDEGEFVMYFQPQVHAGYRNLLGAEALMRWHSPKKGVLPPAEFLPYTNRPEVLRTFTWFALKSAIGAACGWPGELGVAVNVPPSLLRDKDLVSVVGDALEIYCLTPGRLTLEITEDAMIEDPDAAMINMDSFRTRGVRIAIDDFGTGYSSLSYFRDLPVDELKVDRSFVMKMQQEPKDRDIVKAIIDLAHNFSLKVVAEGVENEQTADALQALGCDVLQGYFIGEPVPSEEFRQYL